MNNIGGVEQYFTQLYHQVWEPFSASNFAKFYDKSLVANSAGRSLSFEEMYAHLEKGQQALRHLKADIHYIRVINQNSFVSSLSQILYSHSGQELLRFNTMANYTLKSDKITKVDFLWDKSIDLIINSINLPQSDVLQITLTKRELQCFFHLIQNCSAKKTARLMNISNRTVECYIANIKHKLGIPFLHNFTEYAIERGFLALAPLFTDLLAISEKRYEECKH